MNSNANTSRRNFLTASLMIAPAVLESCRASAPPTSARGGLKPIGGAGDGGTSSLLANGFASLGDLSGAQCREALEQLNAFQKTFLETGPHDSNYPWPRDALHWWSRIWEYPYVWVNLQSLIARDREGRTPILDFGSGVTAFPFFVAKRLGADVLCMDIDASIADSISRTAKKLSIAEHLSFLHNSEYSLPLNAETIGSVYCISVLEHIREPDRIIAEFHRVLKPGGGLLLTMDVATRPQDTVGIGPATYYKLHESLRRHFEPLYDRRPVHPVEILTSESSPLPMRASVSLPARFTEGTALRLRNLFTRGSAIPGWDNVLQCEGFVGRKRS